MIKNFTLKSRSSRIYKNEILESKYRVVSSSRRTHQSIRDGSGFSKLGRGDRLLAGDTILKSGTILISTPAICWQVSDGADADN